MERSPTGRREPAVAAGIACQGFVPEPLPPRPPLAIDFPLQERLDAAHLAIGQLDSLTTLLPDAQTFLYSYVRKEAVLSAQIEGTRSSLSDPVAVRGRRCSRGADRRRGRGLLLPAAAAPAG